MWSVYVVKRKIPQLDGGRHTAIRRVHVRWAAKILLWTFVITIALSASSTEVLGSVGFLPAAFIMVVFILLGVVFDIIGLAVATAVEKPFHSMSARRVDGAVQALWLLRRAEKVSSVCNDMVGDICGIVTGATSVVLASRVASDLAISIVVTQLTAAALAAALTVGGKSLGKVLALRHNTRIVHRLGRIILAFSKIGKTREKQK